MMLKKFSGKILVWILTALCCGCLLYLLGVHVGTGQNDIDEALPDTTTGVRLNDSLPHYLYVWMEDSLELRRDTARHMLMGYSSRNGPFGFSYKQYLAPSTLNRYSPRLLREMHYWDLNNYESESGVSFYTDSAGTTYERRVLFDSVRESGYTRYNGRTRILTDTLREHVARSLDGRIVIGLPIKKSTYEFLNSSARWISIILLGLYLYFIMVLPLLLLADISNGRAFTIRTIRRLLRISLYLFLIAALNILIPYLQTLMFSGSIPEGVRLPFWELLMGQLKWIGGGLVALTIAIAFNRGYKLQQEQDLTI